MKTRKLGKSDIDLSIVGLGTNYVGGHNLYANIDEDEGVRLVQQAIDSGITHLDTADAYGHGRSEELVGQAIRGNRDRVVLATKGGLLFGENGQGVSNDPEYMRGALEKSLKRLGTDYIDLYYVHRYDEKTPIADLIGLLEQFKSEGLIRAIGVSNFSLDNLKAAAAAGSVDAIQSRYNLLQREIESDILPWCADHGVTVIPWGPLAYGLLGGRYERDFKLDADDWRHRSGAFDEDVFTRNIDIVDKLKSTAKSQGLQPAELAIQWLLSQPAVGSVIAGAKTSDQVMANVAAAGADISSIDMVELTTTLNA